MASTGPYKTTASQTLFFPNSLPPELRNMVYKYILQSPELHDITTISNAKQPALQVNQQIRQEAMGLYYTHRNFRVRVTNFDSRLLQIFFQHASYNLADDVAVNLSIFEDLIYPSWDNLIGWAKAYWQDGSLPIPRGGDYGRNAKETMLRFVVWRVFDIVDERVRSRWEEVLGEVQGLQGTTAWEFFDWTERVTFQTDA